MQLTRRQEAWDPFREVEELGLRLNRLIGLNRWPADGEREELALADRAPSCNITEKDVAYHVRAELPDVRKEGLHVTLGGDRHSLTNLKGRSPEAESPSVKRPLRTAPRRRTPAVSGNRT